MSEVGISYGTLIGATPYTSTLNLRLSDLEDLGNGLGTRLMQTMPEELICSTGTLQDPLSPITVLLPKTVHTVVCSRLSQANVSWHTH